MRYVSNCCEARLSRVSSICPSCECDCISMPEDEHDLEDINQPVDLSEYYDESDY